jgi:hypothetical protein
MSVDKNSSDESTLETGFDIINQSVVTIVNDDVGHLNSLDSPMKRLVIENKQNRYFDLNKETVCVEITYPPSHEKSYMLPKERVVTDTQLLDEISRVLTDTIPRKESMSI